MPNQDSEEEKDIDPIVFYQGENNRGFSLAIKTENQNGKAIFYYISLVEPVSASMEHWRKQVSSVF